MYKKICVVFIILLLLWQNNIYEPAYTKSTNQSKEANNQLALTTILDKDIEDIMDDQSIITLIDLYNEGVIRFKESNAKKAIRAAGTETRPDNRFKIKALFFE